MTTAAEGGGDESVEDLAVHGLVDEATRDGYDVRVVVLAREGGEQRAGDVGGADPFDLLAATAMPMPVPHTSTPRSAMPSTTSCATRAA